MQKIVFILLFVFSGIASFSQQEFFVYLQADNNQPFYARISTGMYSSTENGYMIIPKLKDSVYEVVIGFAKNAFPEQNFSFAINKKDKGFQLKNLGEKGWVLVNLQNRSVIMSRGIASKTVAEFSGVKKTDAFSEMLANVVNDSSILYTAVKAPPPEVTPEKKAPVINVPAEKNDQYKDSIRPAMAVPTANTEPVKHADSILEPGFILPKSAADTMEPPAKTSNTSPVIIKPDSSKAINPALAQVITEKPFIAKIEEKKTDGTYQAVYLEQYILSTDTIKIIIPSDESTLLNTIPASPIPEKKTELIPDQKNVSDEKALSSKPVVIDTAASVKKAVEITNSDCKNFATDYDVDKLRIKLLNDKTIDDKLATAKKYFKTKCLSVKQIRALTELFPSDETKYRFFDVSYPYISDTGNFYLLEALIENDYYKNRFKAMIQK